MDLLSIPDNYIKKGRPHGHRYGKKPGDREYYIAHSLKKKCKKKNFLGIHDRLVRDEQFRSQMIEIGRTEDLCRQMDDLADEDHTHHLTPQEYYNYKSNTSIVYFSALKRKNKKLNEINDGHKSSSSWWSWQGSWWTPYSYENKSPWR